MSYTYLQEQEGGSWEECSSDTPQFVLWKLNHIAEKFSCNVNETTSSQSSQSGMTLPPLTEHPGEEKLISFAEDSHAPISQMPTKAKQECLELMENEVDCGLKCLGLFAKFDQESYSWKMCQTFLNLGLESSWETWPQSGIMRNGACWEARIVEEFISVTDYGFSLLTPIASDYKRNNLSFPMWERRIKTKKSPGTLPEQLAWMGLKGMLNPTLAEKMIRFPIAWTDLKPLVTLKIQEWRQLHSEFFQNY